MISGGTVTLQSSRDSRGEKFLRACRINNKSKAITTLNQLYEENINVIHVGEKEEEEEEEEEEETDDTLNEQEAKK